MKSNSQILTTFLLISLHNIINMQNSNHTTLLLQLSAPSQTYLVLEVNLYGHEKACVARLLHFIWGLLAYCRKTKMCHFQNWFQSHYSHQQSPKPVILVSNRTGTTLWWIPLQTSQAAVYGCNICANVKETPLMCSWDTTLPNREWMDIPKLQMTPGIMI